LAPASGIGSAASLGPNRSFRTEKFWENTFVCARKPVAN